MSSDADVVDVEGVPGTRDDSHAQHFATHSSFLPELADGNSV